MMLNQSYKASPQIFYGYIVASAAFILMLTMYSTRYSFGVFFKPILTEFGWTRAMTSGAFSLSMVMEGLLGIVMGGLNDRLGPRIVLTFCSFLLGIGYLLMSQINTVWQLYLFYGVIMGIGLSGAWVPLLSTVARWFVKRRGMMSGIVLTGIGISALITPPVANRLISVYDWRISYIILGGIIFVIVFCAAQLLRRDPSQMGQVPYGDCEEREQDVQLDTDGFSFMEAVYTRQFWQVLAMLFCFGFCLFTIVVHIVPHVTDLGFSTDSAAKILSTIGGAVLIGRVGLGGAADKFGTRPMFMIGFILMTTAFLLLVPISEVWMLCLFAAVFGIAQGGMGPLESPLIAEIFGLKSHGLIFGVAGFGFTIGAALGPFMAGYFFDLTDSYRVAFLSCAFLGIVGLIFITLLTPIKGEAGER